MLGFLVTSAVRRRLLELLWCYDATGTASELAKRAHVSFAAAYRELKRMVGFRLVTSRVEDGRQVYACAADHPDADLMRRLVRARPAAGPPADEAADTTRRQVRSLGAPLAIEAEPVDDGDREQVVVDAIQLARRDATLTRVMPVVLWRQRHALDRDRLAVHARDAHVKHALGFLLAVTAELSGDRSIAAWAESLRDHRSRGSRPFFELPGAITRASRKRPPAVARRWGFTLDLDLDTFHAAFRKHAGGARA